MTLSSGGAVYRGVHHSYYVLLYHTDFYGYDLVHWVSPKIPGRYIAICLSGVKLPGIDGNK